MCIDMKLNHPESIRGQCLRNLSSPVGEVSMMAFLQSAWSSVSYIYVPIDHLYSLVISAGNGALLVKADIKLIKGYIGCFQFTLRIKLY